MKSLPTFHSAEPSARTAGFTLVELLVAMSILACMMLLLMNILSSGNQLLSDSQIRVNNFTKARAMLDLFALDIQCGVFRDDLPAFPMSSIAFITKRPAITSGTGALRDVSLVTYSLSATTSTLQRSDFAFLWSDPASAIAFSNTTSFVQTPTPRDTVSGVLSFKVTFSYADGTQSAAYAPTAANPVHALGLALAIVDDKTLAQLTPNQISQLRAALDAAVTPTGNAILDWNTFLQHGLDWSLYPGNLRTGLKSFQRYVILPNA